MILPYGIPGAIPRTGQPVLWLFESLEKAYEYAEGGDTIVNVQTGIEYHVAVPYEPDALGRIYDDRIRFDQWATVTGVTSDCIFLELDGGHGWVISHVVPMVRKGDRITPGDVVGIMLPSGDL